MSVYQNLITGIMLTICTWDDISSRRIRTRNLILYSLLVIMGKPADAAAGAVPGIFCLLLSAVSRQSLGYGDSILILLSGIALGAEQEMRLVMTAFFLAAVWSVIGLFRKKVKRGSEVPFLPFLLAGWILSIVLAAG